MSDLFKEKQAFDRRYHSLKNSRHVEMNGLKLAIMQPYPFPYMGYFDLMVKVDRWIALDVVQYTRRTSRSWMNRNRVLHPEKGWQYFVLPVARMPLGTSMREMRLSNKSEAERKLKSQLAHYRKRAPYFQKVIDIVGDAFSRTKTDLLVDFNVSSLRVVAEVLGIPLRLELCSELDELIGVEESGQVALQIASRLGSKTYINLPGGRDIYDPQEWQGAGIHLAFSGMTDFQYECSPYVFEPNLSILDVLMWNSSEDVRTWLNGRRLEGIDYVC